MDACVRQSISYSHNSVLLLLQSYCCYCNVICFVSSGIYCFYMGFFYYTTVAEFILYPFPFGYGICIVLSLNFGMEHGMAQLIPGPYANLHFDPDT